MNNAVGIKAQAGVKCKTSQLLDLAFEDGPKVGPFSIPDSKRRLFRAQLTTKPENYFPLPGHSIAESLEAGVRGFEETPSMILPDECGDDQLTFTPHPDPEIGWRSERQQES